MWILKILSGAQQEQTYLLKPGAYVIGRASSCDIVLKDPGISKMHAEIVISPGDIFIKDLNSRNGVFLNGIKVQETQVRMEDRLSIYDVFVELTPDPKSSRLMFPTTSSSRSMVQGSLAVQQSALSEHGASLQESSQSSQGLKLSQEQGVSEMKVEENQISHPQTVKGLFGWAQEYMEEVVLPGIYKLPELLDFKWVLGLFVAGFILFVTSLSSVPLVRILKSSIEQESQRRAATIAKTVVMSNKDLVAQGIYSALSVRFAEREPGVREAYILDSLDGSVLAPSQRLGQFPDVPFVHEARKLGQEGIKQINSNTIVAVSPISVYDSDKGSTVQKAVSVVVYNMGALAVDDGRMISLLIQTFFIALILGLILYFFLYKIVDHPIKDLNNQLDQALKSEKNYISSDYQFPTLQNFISNINSILSRMAEGSEASPQASIEQDRTMEMENLVQLTGFPALVIRSGDFSITALNQGFEETVGLSSSDVLYKALNDLSEQALKLNLQDIIEKTESSPHHMQTGNLEFSGVPHDILLQPIYGGQEVAYYLVVLIPSEGQDAEEFHG